MERAEFDTFNLVLRMVQATASVVLNGLTVLCVVKCQTLWNPAGVLVMSLALTDSLHGLMVYTLPLRTQYRTVCTISLTTEVITLYLQLMIFILIALERRNTLLSQLNRSKKWPVRNIVLVLIGGLAIFVTFNVAYVVGAPNVPTEGVCTNKDTFSQPHRYVAYVYFAVITLTIIAVYGSIAKIMFSSSMQVASNTSQAGQQREAALRITKMMALVVGVFFALYIPMTISFAFLKESPPLWQYVAHQLTVNVLDVNFWINPAIYAWRNKKFREAFKRLFPRCGRLNAVAPVDIPVQQMNISTIAARVNGPIPSTSRTLEPRREYIAMVDDLPEIC